MPALLIRKMLYEDRREHWICSAARLLSDRWATSLCFPLSVLSPRPCVLFTPLGMWSLALASHFTPWFGLARLQKGGCLFAGRGLERQKGLHSLCCTGLLWWRTLSRLSRHWWHQQEQDWLSAFHLWSSFSHTLKVRISSPKPQLLSSTNSYSLLFMLLLYGNALSAYIVLMH